MRAVARVLVGVSGGIAAYKACELIRLFVKGGHEVVPLVTPRADRFVREQTLRRSSRLASLRSSRLRGAHRVSTCISI